MKTSRLVMLTMAAAAVISCNSNEATIRLTLADAPATDVVVKAQNVNQYQILDTLTTDENGKLSYKVEVPEGDPEFFYIYHRNNRVASLLLEAGDKVSIEADTLGNYQVTGSEVSSELAGILAEQKKVDAEFGEIINRLDENNIKELRKEFNTKYIQYYRDRLKFAMDHSKSLLVIPVLYQKIQTEVPVFGNINDGLIFRSISDSLKTAWPESRYAKSLARDAEQRINQMEMSRRIAEAETIGFPDLNLQDKKLQYVRLSEVKAKCILLHFWNPADAAQKMFNQSVLAPLYKEYHDKGLEIYQVAVTSDRTGWGMTLDDQKLPWINVCDVQVGGNSSIALYNLQNLPTSFFISNGTLSDETPESADLKSVRKLVEKLLK